MAVPTLVGAGAQVDGLGSVTPPHPTGLATDDLKLIFISNRMSPGTDMSTVVPGGWNLRWRLERTAGHEAACYYRFHVGGDTAPTITASSDDLIAEMVAYRGVDTTTPFDVADETHGFAAGTTTMTAFNAITTVTDHCRVLGFFASADDNAIAIESTTDANGWDQVYGGSSYDSTTNADEAHCLIEFEKTPAGNTGTPSAIQTVNGPDGYIVVLMALRPLASSSATATPTVLTGTGAAQTPALIVTSKAAPSVLTGTGSQPAPTVVTAFGPAAGAVVGTGTFPAPTINIVSGGITTSPAVLTGHGTFPAPSVSAESLPEAPPIVEIDEPPPPVWWLVADTNGERRLIAQFDSLKVTLPAEANPDTVTFVMLGDDVVLRDIVELQTDVLVYRNTKHLTTARLISVDDSLGEDEYVVQLGCVDYRGVLEHRSAHNLLEYTQVDKGEIVWRVIQHTQALNSGDLGITAGLITTGVLGDLTVPIGAYLAKTFDEYAKAAAGFGWWIDPDLVLQVQTPRRERDMTTTILEHGANLKQVSRKTTAAKYTNVDRVFGAEGTTSATSSQLPDPRGRWEKVESYPDVKEQATVTEKSVELLTAGTSPLGSWTVDVEPGVWGFSVDLDPGDLVTFRAQRGRLAVNRVCRVSEIGFDLDADGNETISLVLDEEPELPGGRGPIVRSRPEMQEADTLTALRRRIEILERITGGDPGPGGPSDPGGGGDPGATDDDMVQILTHTWERGGLQLEGGTTTRFPERGDDLSGPFERYYRPMFPGSAVLWTPGRFTFELWNVDAVLPAGGVEVKFSKRSAAGAETVLGTITIASGTAADSPAERTSIFRDVVCTGSVGPTDVVFFDLTAAPTANSYVAEANVYGVHS